MKYWGMGTFKQRFDEKAVEEQPSQDAQGRKRSRQLDQQVKSVGAGHYVRDGEEACVAGGE